jgi:hypothetical protein
MSTRRAIVQNAIRFGRPERIPIWFYNRDHAEGEILAYGMGLRKADSPGISEWGYRFQPLDNGTMGYPDDPLLPDWDAAQRYEAPALRETERMAGVPRFLEAAGDRYRLASLGITGFNVYTFLRGFENSMFDFVAEPGRAGRLIDTVLGFETVLVSLAGRYGFDGVHFGDDWGTQKDLMVSPRLWRDLFKARYARQFRTAHDLGLHVWFHSCGNIASIVEDMHEIGIDVLNLSQPNAVDLGWVGKRLRGQQCFLLPISYQTVSISGTPESIHAEARRLYAHLGTPEGGFIGYLEDYPCMGMPEENYRACAAAFRSLNAPAG